MAKKFNWDEWTNFDDYRVDDDGVCDVISTETTSSSSTSSTGSTGTSGIPEEDLKCPPRIETFLLLNSTETELFMESGYLC